MNNKTKYDTAAIGSSALTAALKRNVWAEVAKFLGGFSACVFNDFEKFFDTLDIPTLLTEAIYAEFPARKLVLVLQQHLAPRMIQANGYSDDPMQVFRSIIAGCKASVALTRVYLKRSITKVDSRFPDANTSLFVDDTSMQATDSEFDGVLQKIVPAVAFFGEEVQRLKLSLSPKGGDRVNDQACWSPPERIAILWHGIQD